MPIMVQDPALRKCLDDYRDADLAARRRQIQEGARPGAESAPPQGSEIEYLPYGATDEKPAVACELLATLGSVESEYAAFSRGAGVFPSSHRGTLVVTGAARGEFLNRMVTQELKGISAGDVRPAFWLNRKGRIDADLLLIELGERMLIDVDVHQAASAAESLAAFIFSEDVEIREITDQQARLAVHGRLALNAVGVAAGLAALELADRQARTISIAGHSVVAARRDQVGDVGVEIFTPVEAGPAVLRALLESDRDVGSNRRRVRPVGWYAYNIARIEAGTPLFNVDFGPTNLPHETGVLADRVSFTKGCYLGQEVVARMQSLGRPKQELVGLRMQRDLLPVAGSQIFQKTEQGMGPQIGVITSSTLSPMFGAAPIGFGMIKSTQAQHGNRVLVNAEGEQTDAVVGPLRFWPPRESAT